MEVIGYRGTVSRNLDKTIVEEESATCPEQYLVYGTGSRVIGILSLPPNGDHNKSVSVIGHTGNINGLGVTMVRGSPVVVSTSSDDYILASWEVNLANMQNRILNAAQSNTEQQNGLLYAPRQSADKGQSLMENQWQHPRLHKKVQESCLPYYQQLNDGGLGGSVHNEAENIFTLLQLQAGKKASRARSHLGNAIPLSSLPVMFQALGYYPSQSEMKEILNELKYSNFSQSGVMADCVTMDEAIQTYVCRRPVFGMQKNTISDAVSI